MYILYRTSWPFLKEPKLIHVKLLQTMVRGYYFVHSVQNWLALLKEPKVVYVKLLQTMVRGYCVHSVQN